MNKSFIAVDFETANGRRTSVCEIGICVVRNGEIVDTKSWLIRPEGNIYNYMNIQIHGIRPKDTEDAPNFAQVWEEIEREYLDEFDTMVAHNASFDRCCLERTAQLYHLHLPVLRWHCSLRIAKKIYNYGCNTLAFLCENLGIREGRHHRAGDDAEMCARLFLREMEDIENRALNEVLGIS